MTEAARYKFMKTLLKPIERFMDKLPPTTHRILIQWSNFLKVLASFYWATSSALAWIDV